VVYVYEWTGHRIFPIANLSGVDPGTGVSFWVDRAHHLVLPVIVLMVAKRARTGPVLLDQLASAPAQDAAEDEGDDDRVVQVAGDGNEVGVARRGRASCAELRLATMSQPRKSP
jgi:hypothetical protein